MRSAATALVLALLLPAVASCDGDEEDARPGRGGSERVDAPRRVDIVRTPASYAVHYRVETAGRRLLVGTDRVVVRRPFESRLETWTGEPPGRRRESTQIGAFGRQSFVSRGNERQVLEVPIGVPPSDVRLETTLGPASDAGLVERREVRRVAGRLCQVYRSGRQPSDATFARPTADGYADFCVDEAGIVVESIVYAEGRPLVRRVAVKVDEEPALAEDLFAVGRRTLEVRDGGGRVRLLEPGNVPPGEFFVLPAPLEGWEYRGRWSVIPPQPENFTGDVLREGHRHGGFVDVWVRGPDFVIVDQGATLRGPDPFVLDLDGPTEDMGRFGRGQVLLGGLGNQVRVLLGGGRYLRVAGTLPPAELAGLARRLERTEGTELRFAEG